jgi:hypothetical protein
MDGAKQSQSIRDSRRSSGVPAVSNRYFPVFANAISRWIGPPALVIRIQSKNAVRLWEEIVMRTVASLLLLIGCCGIGTVAAAQQSNECKLCREVQQACLKNHSKDACNHEYTVCMNHCRKK